MGPSAAATAHSVLHHIMSRAVLEGKTGVMVMYIPLLELEEALEGLVFAEDASDLVLKISIQTSWEAADDVEEVLISNFNGEEDEEVSGHDEGEQETDVGTGAKGQAKRTRKTKKSN